MIVLITCWNRKIRKAFEECTELHTVIRWGWQNQPVNLASVLIWSGGIRGGSSFKRPGTHVSMYLSTLTEIFYQNWRSGILAKYLIVIEDRHLLGKFWIYLKTPNTGPYRSGAEGKFIWGGGGKDSHLLGNFLFHIKIPNIDPYRSEGGGQYLGGGGDDLLGPVLSIWFGNIQFF